MQVAIKGKNLDISEHLRSYVEKKVSRLDRFLPGIDDARVELSVLNTRSAGDSQVAQCTVRTGSGAILRSEERSSDLQTAIDAMLGKMERQVERYKGKHFRSMAREQAASARAEESATSAGEESEGGVVRVKRFQTRPMHTEEAIEQMELLGHDFFVFFDASDNAFNVVYRRRDGGYGLLKPELA